jgi:hypothetical protein
MRTSLRPSIYPPGIPKLGVFKALWWANGEKYAALPLVE